MQWLADNYKWLPDGVGGAALILLISWLLRRFFKEPAAGNTDASLFRQASQVSNSPVTRGSGNMTTIVQVTPQPAAPVSAPPVSTPKPERLNPNIQMIGTGVVHVYERRPRVWKEDGPGTEQAVIIQFTDEARREGRNVGGLVKASLVYSTAGQPDLRIVGSWLNEGADCIEFRVDESHKLIVGLLYGQTFVTVGRHRVSEQGGFSVEAQPHELRVIERLTVRVRLTNANTGDFLYEREFRVTLNPLGIVAEDL